MPIDLCTFNFSFERERMRAYVYMCVFVRICRVRDYQSLCKLSVSSRFVVRSLFDNVRKCEISIK